MYVSYGKWIPDGNQAQIWVAQLTGDLQNKNSQTVFHTTPDLGYIEGTRFYKINGTYYILLTNPGVGNGEIILKSSGGSFGPYSNWHRILKNNGNPVPGASSPYQGAIVETQHGDWWYMAFVNSYPGARIPVLAPLTWDANGWPNVQLASGDKWGTTYPYPLPKHPVKPITGTDTFASSTLGPQYEWNHNPDDSKWAVGGGLTLRTATVTNDFFAARNTLSHRALGPRSVATIELDFSGLANGDTAGLSVFWYDAAWIAVHKNGAADVRVQMVDRVLMDPTGGWHTNQTGTVVADAHLPNTGSVWLRVRVDISGSPGYANFSYSTDGKQFSALGRQHVMADGAVFFMGDRFGMFNFATKQLGGKAVVKSWTLSEA
jgi:beta-xylosidase